MHFFSANWGLTYSKQGKLTVRVSFSRVLGLLHISPFSLNDHSVHPFVLRHISHKQFQRTESLWDTEKAFTDLFEDLYGQKFPLCLGCVREANNQDVYLAALTVFGEARLA